MKYRANESSLSGGELCLLTGLVDEGLKPLEGSTDRGAAGWRVGSDAGEDRSQEPAIGAGEEQRELEDNRLLARTMAAVRQTGMILAIELVKDKAYRVPYPWQERRGRIVYVHGLSRGVLLRPLRDVIYFMPPYVITEDHIRFMAEVATEGIERATAE